MRCHLGPKGGAPWIPPLQSTCRLRARGIAESETITIRPTRRSSHATSLLSPMTAYFGLQYRGDPPTEAARLLADIVARFSDANGPSHWDRAADIDQAGFSNVVSVAYWDHVARFDAWFAPTRQAWTGQRNDSIRSLAAKRRAL